MSFVYLLALFLAGVRSVDGRWPEFEEVAEVHGGSGDLKVGCFRILM